MTRRGKNKKKLNTREKVNVAVPKNSDRMARDEEDLQNGTRKSFWRRWIGYPSKFINILISSIFRLNLSTYQKVEGKSPSFSKGKAEDSKQEISKLTNKIKELTTEKQILWDKNNRFAASNTAQTDENIALTESKKELENAKRDLLIANEKLLREKEHLKVKNEEQEKELRDRNSELKKNKEQADKNKELDAEIKNLRDKSSKLEKKNKEQADKHKELDGEIKELRDKNSELEEKNKELADKIEEINEKNVVKEECLKKELQQSNEQQSQQIDSLNKKMTVKLEKIETLRKEIESLKSHAFSLQDGLTTEKCENTELRDRIKILTDEKSVLEEEKLDALRRLSEQVSVKLRDNNPNIVDLSDQCRPTKLAEMFSELYDNEWTNAFSVLEDTLTEEQAIVVLLDTVMIAYGFCETKVNEPWQVLTDWFIDESLPGVQQTTKWLKDSRKTNIQKKVSETEKNFSEAILRMCTEESLKTLLSDTDMNLYFTKCIELCLLMVATDPPVVLVCPGWNPINRTADDKKPQYEQEKTHTDQMMEGHNETTSHIDREQGGDHNETESRNNKEPDADRNETTSLNNTEQDYDRDDTASHTDTEQDDDCKDTASHVDTEQVDNCQDTASHADTEQDNDCKDTASHADTKQDDDRKNNASNTNTEQDDDRNESKSHTNTGQDNDRNETANHYNTEKVEIHLETTRHTNREQDEGHNKTVSHTNTDHEGTNMENGGDHGKTASNTNTEQNVDQKETATHSNTEQDGHQNETTSRTNMDQDEGHNETASTNNMQQGEDDGETAKNNSIEQGDVYCIEGDEQGKELINVNTEENQAIGESQPENQTQHHVKDLDVNDSTSQGITYKDVLGSLTQSLQQDRCQENDQEPVSGESEIANKYDLVNTQQQEDLEGKIMNDNYDKMIKSTEGEIDDSSQTTLPDNFVTNGEGVPQTEQEGNTKVQDAQQINRVGSIIIDKTDEPQPQQQAENSADTEFAGDGDTFFGNTADDGEQQEDRTESVTKPEEGPKDGLINGYDGSYRGTAEEGSRDNVHEGKMVHPHLENDAVHTDANKNKDNPGESLSHDFNQERNGNTIVSDEKMKEETPINTEGGHLFDKELFKEYTRRGKYLDFIVWPAMCLHKDGPLLSKGVAQGRKDQYAAKNVTGWTWRRLK